jgi:hypothetical protein
MTDDDFKALRDAQPSIPKQSNAEASTFLSKIQPTDLSQRHDAGSEENRGGDTEGTNNNPLPILPDITVYDTDGTTVLHTGNGNGFWPVVIDGGSGTVDVAWNKVNWCKDGSPGTRFVLMSPFEAD